MMFEVGDVVVCVDDGGPTPLPADVPTRGFIYRVDGLPRSPWGNIGLSLVGMNPAPHTGYKSSRFRKLERASESFTLSIKRHADEPVS